MVAQVTLFTGVEGFEDYQKAVEDMNKGKRGHYNKIPKPKHTDNEWQNMKLLYKQLANFLDIPHFYDRDAVYYFSDNRIKAWCFQYTEEEYEYQGITYTGEEFKTREAEIVGSENYDLETRISLHKELISYLEEGVTLDNAVDKIQPRLKELQELHKLGEFAQWLRRHRG